MPVGLSLLHLQEKERFRRFPFHPGVKNRFRRIEVIIEIVTKMNEDDHRDIDEDRRSDVILDPLKEDELRPIDIVLDRPSPDDRDHPSRRSSFENANRYNGGYTYGNRNTSPVGRRRRSRSPYRGRRRSPSLHYRRRDPPRV